MRLFLGLIALALSCGGCSPTSSGVDIDFNNTTPMTAEAENKFNADRLAFVKRFNENARITNARISEYYKRGVKVCANLKRAGYPDGNGCPRPKPKYVEYLK